MENARDAYHLPDEQRVTPCPAEGHADSGDGDVIVVCRQRSDGARYQFEGPAERPVGADVVETPSGAPRAPDFNESCLHSRGRANCLMVGSAPPPAIMIDLAALPEPLSPEDAAAVFRLEDRLTAGAGQAAPAPAP